jgi:hypothetical protein
MDPHIEYIYNTYLRVSRQQTNKPFRYRKNFEGFEKEANYLPTLRLKSFFSRNPKIKIEDYFLAPYVVFCDDKSTFYELNFYNSLQATKTYSIYSKKVLMEDPDSDIQLQKIKEGLVFIKNFCIENQILLNDYLNFKSKKIHDFLIHLTEKKITIYNLFPFKGFDKTLKQYDYELLSFIVSDIAPRVSYFRSRFYASTYAKKLCVEGLKKTENIIKKALENTKNTSII